VKIRFPDGYPEPVVRFHWFSPDSKFKLQVQVPAEVPDSLYTLVRQHRSLQRAKVGASIRDSTGQPTEAIVHQIADPSSSISSVPFELSRQSGRFTSSPLNSRL